MKNKIIISKHDWAKRRQQEVIEMVENSTGIDDIMFSNPRTPMEMDAIEWCLCLAESQRLANTFEF